MANEPEELLRLGPAERWISGLIAMVGLTLGIWLILCAPMRYTIITDSKHNQTITQTASEQSTTIVALLASSAAFLFYALNGLRLNKFSAGPISGESSRNPSSTVPPSAKEQLSAQGAVAGQAARNEQELRFNRLSEPQKKILRTLWRYQTSQFPDDFKQRWTFRVAATASDYPQYLEALSTLLKAGLVFVNPANDQCGLTEEGIVMMKSLKDDEAAGAYYVF
jgi:hypothetical protein